MPYINTKTTITIDKSKRDLLTSEMGKITDECLGKSENWLMVGYEDNADLYFKGNKDNDTVYIEVKLFGDSSDSAYSNMTKKVCELYTKELEIPSDRIYVAYFPTNSWGWNGNNF